MSNVTSIVFGGLVVLAIVLDQVLNGGNATVFLGRKFVDVIAWIAFWR